MSRDRGIAVDVADAIERWGAAKKETRALIRVTFPAADSAVAVVHGLQTDPNFLARRIVRANANVIDAPGVVWTYEVAYLQADAANAEALVEFVIVNEDVAPLARVYGPVETGGIDGGDA